MASYIVTYKGDGVRRRERIRATSEEEAKSKSRSRHPKFVKFDIVSVELVSKSRPMNPSNLRIIPTFKQFTCSFSTMNNGKFEAHQIALHALDEGAAKDELKNRYQSILESTIHIVEAR